MEAKGKQTILLYLGALLEATELLPEEDVTQALERLVKSGRWLEIDRRALLRGRETIKSGGRDGN